MLMLIAKISFYLFLFFLGTIFIGAPFVSKNYYKFAFASMQAALFVAVDAFVFSFLF